MCNIRYEKIVISVISIFLFFGLKSHAQYDNVWTFGRRAGIDFNSQPPRAITTGINTTEGCASICDSTGQLLFYTDGNSVWDRNNDTMPNGRDLPGLGINITNSTTQGALIVPMPGSNEKYYIFSLGGLIEDTTHLGRLYYSIIDMTLNNGLGDVISGSKGLLLDSFLTEHMTGVSGNNCDIWVIVVSRIDNTFKSYNINTNGIDIQPVLSPGLTEKRLQYYREFAGNIDISPNRNKLAIAHDKLILYDFDPDSGTIRHPVVLDTFYIPPISAPSYAFGLYYGIAFSPDNSKLYTSIHYVEGLWQFDLSSADSLTMTDSKVLVTKEMFSGIKRGPDGKVYCGLPSSNRLGVVHKPNLTGLACQYEDQSFQLANGTSFIFGLPNYPTIATRRQVYHSQSDTAFCVSVLSLSARNLSGRNYEWEDGSKGATRVVDSPGVYWVSYEVNSPCMFDECMDTFKVVFDFSRRNIYTTIRDSGMCKSDTLLLNASSFGGTDYIWEDGSTGMSRAVNKTGTYWLSYQIDSLCAHHVDSFLITYPEKEPEVSFKANQFVCTGDTIQFENTSDPNFNYLQWSFGDNSYSMQENPRHRYLQPGQYEVTLIGKIGDICPDTAYQTIAADSLFANFFTKDKDSICTGESITFTPQVKSNTISNLQWQLGDSNYVNTDESHALQHAYSFSGKMTVQLKTQFRACPESFITNTIYVFPLPLVTLGTDISLCLNGSPVMLKNLLPDKEVTQSFLWNTGDTSEIITVRHPGIYNLTVSNGLLGCNSSASIEIKKDCYIDIPNAFTPNDDGINDYFFPRQLLSESITSFHMQIFNRWGQKLFETTSTNGRGWDGKFNSLEQPEGVYVYLIKIEFKESVDQQYQGNVVLLR